MVPNPEPSGRSVVMKQDESTGSLDVRLKQAIIINRIDATPFKRIHIFFLFVLGAGLLFDTIENALTNVIATDFFPGPDDQSAGVEPSACVDIRGRGDWRAAWRPPC